MRGFGAAVLVAATAVATLTPLNVATAAEAKCQVDIPVSGDVDGDGSSDLLVGLPGRNNGAGEVDLRLTTAPSRILTRQNAGLGQGAPGDAFGATVVLADLNDDGCDDIIVGAPGTGGAGRVHVILGAEDGFQTTDGLTLAGGATSGDRFGSSLAIAPNQAGTGFHLWVGAPLDDVESVSNAGSVLHYLITNSGGELDFGQPETITQALSKVPGSAEANDQFGAALSATPRGVVVGDPREDIGSAKNAGSITLLQTTNAARFDQAITWSQASPGVPGNAETGDHFGAGVGVFREHFAAGVPDKDVDGHGNAGMVQLFSWSSAAPVPTGEVKHTSRGFRGKSRPAIGSGRR